MLTPFSRAVLPAFRPHSAMNGLPVPSLLSVATSGPDVTRKSPSAWAAAITKASVLSRNRLRQKSATST